MRIVDFLRYCAIILLLIITVAEREEQVGRISIRYSQSRFPYDQDILTARTEKQLFPSCFHFFFRNIAITITIYLIASASDYDLVV